MAKGISDADVTVTTATRSEAEVRESLGTTEPKAAVAVVDEKPVVAATEPTPDAAVDQEAESTKPDAEVSQAARTLRLSRADKRKSKIQTEIDELVHTREKTREDVDRLKKLRAELATPPKPADAAVPKPDDKPAENAAPKFKFQTYEQYQAEHPNAPWEDYLEARDEAREVFSEARRKDTEAKGREAAERTRQDAEVRVAFEETNTHVQAFKAERPDFDDKLSSFSFPGVELSATGQLLKATNQYLGLQKLLLRDPKAAPSILYYLATHHDDATRLSTAQTPTDLIEIFGEVKLAARTATPAKAAGALPSVDAPVKPRSSAPAPIDTVPGASSHARSSAQVSEADGDDADSYIEQRRREQGLGPRRVA